MLKLTVIIPTRERAETLIHTLRTVVEQSYTNLEIIVSDNASSDQTIDVVKSYSDSRIKYINTGKRLGMSENYEFALSQVTGDYVMYLGDDDGLLPNACLDVVKILNATSSKAVIWNKCDYNWASSIFLSNHISIFVCNNLITIDSKILLKAVANGVTSYGRLPVVYSGFVSMNSINNIRKKTGRFFHSITPDVYSGIVLAEELNQYLYSFRPFSINGGSAKSTGQTTMSNNERGKLFFTESSIGINESMPIIRGSIQSHVAEAFLQAQKVNLLKNYHLNYKRVHQNILNEVTQLEEPLRSDGLKTLLNMQLSSSIRKQVETAFHNEKRIENISDKPDTTKQTISNSVAGYLFFDTTKFSIQNSYDACLFVGNLLGSYRFPSRIKHANSSAFIISYLKRKISPYLDRYLLPF